MGLRDALFGRKKLSEPRDDRLFALTTAAITLETELNLKTAGKAAITFKPLSSGEFTRVGDDVESLIKAAGRSAGSEIERKSDTYGYEWLIVHDDDLEDQVTSIHAVASELTAQGFGAQLLAAPFLFTGYQHPVYWIYGFKRGAFWPFIPTGDGQNRDNARELELKAKLEGELPIEPDLTRWLGLFDAPI
jgi:PspA associated protein B